MPRPADHTLRERLIAAATVEFADNGYSGSTLEAIAARAEVTKGGLYFHFAGKEELFFAVLDHWREHRRKELQVQGVGPDGAVFALRHFLASYLAFHLREPAATHLLRVLATELRGRFTARLREDDRQEQRWFRARVRELLELGVRDGTRLAGGPALTADSSQSWTSVRTMSQGKRDAQSREEHDASTIARHFALEIIANHLREYVGDIHERLEAKRRQRLAAKAKTLNIQQVRAVNF